MLLPRVGILIIQQGHTRLHHLLELFSRYFSRHKRLVAQQCGLRIESLQHVRTTPVVIAVLRVVHQGGHLVGNGAPTGLLAVVVVNVAVIVCNAVLEKICEFFWIAIEKV
jgi:hypothetical protein